MRFIIIFALLSILSSCKEEDNTKLKTGMYRATLEVQDGKELPFNFKVRNDEVIEIYNAEEVIEVDEISYFNDSIRINFPIYEGYIVGKFSNGAISNAKYIKESLDRVVPATITYDSSERFLDLQPTNQDISGVWEMVFTEEDGSKFIAKGIFKQEGNKMTGTIRTTTGDYRYLEGVVSANLMKYSVFDGAHAFLFTGKIANTGNAMKGEFYSGNHYRAIFKGKRNTDFELPHEDSLTFLNDNYDSLEFSFPDL